MHMNMNRASRPHTYMNLDCSIDQVWSDGRLVNRFPSSALHRSRRSSKIDHKAAIQKQEGVAEAKPQVDGGCTLGTGACSMISTPAGQEGSMASYSPSPPRRLLYWQALFLPRVFWTTCHPSVWDRRCVDRILDNRVAEFGMVLSPHRCLSYPWVLFGPKCCILCCFRLYRCTRWTLASSPFISMSRLDIRTCVAGMNGQAFISAAVC